MRIQTDNSVINPIGHIAPQGLPTLEKQLERLLRDPNALRNDALYGKPWSDAENAAHRWVDHQRKTIAQQLAANGLAMSGRAERRLTLEIPFEAAERRILGLLESRRHVLARLDEVKRLVDEQSTPSDRTKRHQREIERLEYILGIDGQGVRHIEEDQEYGPVFHLIKEKYQVVEKGVRKNAGLRISKHKRVADSLIRDTNHAFATYCGKAIADLLREIQSRLEHERLCLNQAAKPAAAQTVNHYEQLKGRVCSWFTKWRVLAAIILIVSVAVSGVIWLDDFLDAIDGIWRRLSISFSSEK